LQRAGCYTERKLKQPKKESKLFANRFVKLFALAVLVVVITLIVADYQVKTSNASVADQSFHTPPTSNYPAVVSTPGWRTPPTSNYTPDNPVGDPGWRTPPTSNYTPNNPVATPGWRTPPTSDYRP
jgi:hypothetical protein